MIAFYETLWVLPPVELKGMALLRERQMNPGFFPTDIPRETLVEAVIEVTVYTQRSLQTRDALAQLGPMPIINQSVGEYGL